MRLDDNDRHTKEHASGEAPKSTKQENFRTKKNVNKLARCIFDGWVYRPIPLDLENLFSTNYIKVNTVNNTSYRSVEFRQEIKKRMAEFDVLWLKTFPNCDQDPTTLTSLHSNPVTSQTCKYHVKKDSRLVLWIHDWLWGPGQSTTNSSPIGVTSPSIYQLTKLSGFHKFCVSSKRSLYSLHPVANFKINARHRYQQDIHTDMYGIENTHTYTHIPVYTHRHSHIHTHIYRYAHAHAHTHTYRYTHTHTHKHTHTQTKTHTHLLVKREKFVVQIERDKKWKGYIFEVMYQLATLTYARYNIPRLPPHKQHTSNSSPLQRVSPTPSKSRAPNFDVVGTQTWMTCILYGDGVQWLRGVCILHKTSPCLSCCSVLDKSTNHSAAPTPHHPTHTPSETESVTAVVMMQL